MKHLMIALCLLLVLGSCKKNKSMGFTSDVPNDFITSISVLYNESQSLSTVEVRFFDATNEENDNFPYVYPFLKLPSNSYIMVNGVELEWHSVYYKKVFEGKPNLLLELKNHDGVIYKNTLIPPDTAYFIDFPDTVLSPSNILFQVNAPNLDSNESTSICEGGFSYEPGCFPYPLDTVISLAAPYLGEGLTNFVVLARSKSITNPNFPLGGGSINYHYLVDQSFYYK